MGVNLFVKLQDRSACCAVAAFLSSHSVLSFPLWCLGTGFQRQQANSPGRVETGCPFLY